MSKSRQKQYAQTSLDKKSLTNIKRRLVICLPQKKNSNSHQSNDKNINELQYQKLQRHQWRKSKDKQCLTTKNQEIQLQFGKLIEITVRCYDYFKKFEQERLAEDILCDNTFDSIQKQVQKIFNQLFDRLKNKKEQLVKFVAERKSYFKKKKTNHERQLRESLSNIGKLKKKYLSEILTSKKCYQETSKQLNIYANSLNIFYEKVEEIEKVSIKELLQQNQCFINNGIRQEVKLFVSEELYTQQNKDLNFSFNNQHLFTLKGDVQLQQNDLKNVGQTVKKQQKPNILSEIQNKQRQRLKNIKGYKQSISVCRQIPDIWK